MAIKNYPQVLSSAPQQYAGASQVSGPASCSGGCGGPGASHPQIDVSRVATRYPVIRGGAEIGSASISPGIPNGPRYPLIDTGARWARDCVNVFDVDAIETQLISWVAAETTRILALGLWSGRDLIPLPRRLSDGFRVTVGEQETRVRHFLAYNQVFGEFFLDAMDPGSRAGSIPTGLIGGYAPIRARMSPTWNPVYMTSYPVHGTAYVEATDIDIDNYVDANIGQEIVLGRMCTLRWLPYGDWWRLSGLLPRHIREPVVELATYRRRRAGVGV